VNFLAEQAIRVVASAIAAYLIQHGLSISEATTMIPVSAVAYVVGYLVVRVDRHGHVRYFFKPFGGGSHSDN
jgi:hypothetical protein